jgi:beta-N-acetylhexosaminidase
MLLAGVPVAGLSAAVARERAHSLIADYLQAGIRAFLFPGDLLGQPELLAALTALARLLAEEAELGPPLLALGGGAAPGFGQPDSSGIASPLALAALGSRAAVRRAGRLLGLRLSQAGVDLLLSPRLDLATDPKGRAGILDGFGEDGRVAGKFGAIFAGALASRGVSACAGRFPGLGTLCSSCENPPPLVSLPVDRLEETEMRPFAWVVRGGIRAILVGRALFPALEPDKISAARSARIIEGRLREELGFKGVAIGDELGVEREPGRAAVLGALAGCDLALASEPAVALAAAKALDAAVAAGELPAPRVVVARRRVDALIAYGARRPTKAAIPSAAIAACELDLERSLTVLRDRGGFSIGPGPTLVAVFLPSTLSAAETEACAAALRRELPEARLELLHADPAPAEAEAIARRLSEGHSFASAVILTCDAHLRPAQEGLAHSIEESVERCAVVAMRDPYDVAFFPRAAILIAAYGVSAAGCGAAARLLAGKAEARGSCPVQVIGLEL